MLERGELINIMIIPKMAPTPPPPYAGNSYAGNWAGFRIYECGRGRVRIGGLVFIFLDLPGKWDGKTYIYITYRLIRERIDDGRV